MDTLMARFAGWMLTGRGLAETTARRYARTVERTIQQADVALVDADLDDLTSLIRGRARADALLAFYDYLVDIGRRATNPLRQAPPERDPTRLGLSAAAGVCTEPEPTLVHVRDDLHAQGLSASTVRQYLKHVTRAQRWMAARGFRLTTAPATVVADYAASQPVSYEWRTQIRSSLARYWQLAGRKDPPIKAIRIPPKPHRRPRPLDRTVAGRLAAEAARIPDAPGTATLAALYAGLRRFEVARLAWGHLQPDGTLVVCGKGGRVASLPVHARLAEAVSRYRHSGKAGRSPIRPDDTWLFPGRGDHPHVHPATVWSWVVRIAHDAGLDDAEITPHRLRHTCLTDAYETTGDLRACQILARHADPAVTATYTRVSSRRLQGAVDALDYLDGS